MLCFMALEMGTAPTQHFQHDLLRLNQLAEQVALFATVWLGQMMQQTYLPDHAKEAYISTLAHNYNRGPHSELAQHIRRLAWRLEHHYSSTDQTFSASLWVAQTRHLNTLPALPDCLAERRFMRYLSLRDMNEFISAFAATPQQRHQLRPWVLAALNTAMRHNQLEQAWDNSITLWDRNHTRPRTVVRARLQPGLWHNPGDNITRH